MSIKLSEDEYNFLIKHMDIPISRDMDINLLMSELNLLIVIKGLTEDQETLNDFGLIAQDVYDSINYHNRKGVCDEREDEAGLSNS